MKIKYVFKSKADFQKWVRLEMYLLKVYVQ